MRKTALGVAALLMLVVFAGCGGSSGTRRESPPQSVPTTTPASTVPGPQARWHAANITHYRFDFQPSCFCSNVDMRIEVRDGKVVRTTALPPNTGLAVDVATDGQRPTIDTLLADLERAQTSPDKGEIRATYDPTTGVPTSASIDWIKNAADDEIAWTITNFTAL